MKYMILLAGVLLSVLGACTRNEDITPDASEGSRTQMAFNVSVPGEPEGNCSVKEMKWGCLFFLKGVVRKIARITIIPGWCMSRENGNRKLHFTGFRMKRVAGWR